jgi:hypothetical protein
VHFAEDQGCDRGFENRAAAQCGYYARIVNMRDTLLMESAVRMVISQRVEGIHAHNGSGLRCKAARSDAQPADLGARGVVTVRSLSGKTKGGELVTETIRLRNTCPS